MTFQSKTSILIWKGAWCVKVHCFC